MRPEMKAGLDAKFASKSVLSRSVSMERSYKVYEHFHSQRSFIRAMTDIAEQLRMVAPAARQEALEPYLTKLSVPPLAYFPLVRSDEPCCSLLRFTPHESIVFNTKVGVYMCRQHLWHVHVVCRPMCQLCSTPRWARGRVEPWAWAYARAWAWACARDGHGRGLRYAARVCSHR